MLRSVRSRRGRLFSTHKGTLDTFKFITNIQNAVTHGFHRTGRVWKIVICKVTKAVRQIVVE